MTRTRPARAGSCQWGERGTAAASFGDANPMPIGTKPGVAGDGSPCRRDRGVGLDARSFADLGTWRAGPPMWVGSPDPGSSSAPDPGHRQFDDEGQEPGTDHDMLGMKAPRGPRNAAGANPAGLTERRATGQ